MYEGRNADCDVFKVGFSRTPCTVDVIPNDDWSSSTSSSRSNSDSSSGGSSLSGNSKNIKNSTEKVKIECVKSDFNVDKGKSKIIPFKASNGKLSKQVTFESKDKTIPSFGEKIGKIKGLKEISIQR